MKDKLICCVYDQMSHLETVDTKELGEAIDMIKDLSEAIYYCTITKAMEEKEPEYYDMEGMIHHDEHGRSSAHGAVTGGTGSSGHMYEGKSGHVRKMYMEAREKHHDKTIQMQELEKYAQELTNDLVEMIEDSTPEEKQFLSNRIAALATKIK